MSDGHAGDSRRPAPPSTTGSKGGNGAESKRGGETVPGGGGRTELPEVFGRYHVKKKLGGGGMGAVYLVQNTELEREEALKVPHFDVGEDPEVRERFLREAKSAAKLDHPNLCPVVRRGGAGRHLLPDHALPQGQAPLRLRRQAPARSQERRDRHQVGPGAGGRPRQGHHPPRPQAQQRHPVSGHGADRHGLRPRQTEQATRQQVDPGRHRDGNAGVHATGAGQGRSGQDGAGQRCLQPGRHPLRITHRPLAL